jgi:hypothetical protein
LQATLLGAVIGASTLWLEHYIRLTEEGFDIQSVSGQFWRDDHMSTNLTCFLLACAWVLDLPGAFMDGVAPLGSTHAQEV